MQQIIVTKHARQRLIERIGSRKAGLYFLRSASLSYKREDGRIIYLIEGFRFIVEDCQRYWKLITVLRNGDTDE